MRDLLYQSSFEGVRPKYLSTKRININNRLIKLNNARDFIQLVRDKKARK